MQQSTPVHSPYARSLAPDLARGFVLLFIALANVSWYLWGQQPGPVGPHPAPQSTADSIIQVLVMTVVDGRSYPMFTFLFAYGMVQFFTSRRARGLPEAEVRRMLLRRHLTLLVLGLLHATLLFAGDILGAYAVAGLVVGAIFFLRRSSLLRTWVIVVAAIMVAAALVTLGVGVLIQWMQPFDTGVAANPSDAALGDYLQAMGQRLWLWAAGSAVGGLLAPAPVLMLVGWLAARVRLLEDVHLYRRTLVRVAAWTIPLGWATGLLNGLVQVGVLRVDHAPWMFTGVAMVAGMGTGVGYACLFGLLGARWTARPPRPVRAVAALGQRSLSGYLWQSILLAPLLSAWGFGLGDDIGTWQAMLLATGTWFVSLVVADLLGRRGLRGPFEWVLRRITYGRYAGPPPSPAARSTAELHHLRALAPHGEAVLLR